MLASTLSLLYPLWIGVLLKVDAPPAVIYGLMAAFIARAVWKGQMALALPLATVATALLLAIWFGLEVHAERLYPALMAMAAVNVFVHARRADPTFLSRKVGRFRQLNADEERRLTGALTLWVYGLILNALVLGILVVAGSRDTWMWFAGVFSYVYLGALILATVLYTGGAARLKKWPEAALYTLNHTYNFGMFVLMCLAAVPILAVLYVLHGGMTDRYRETVQDLSYYSFRFVTWHTRLFRFIDIRFHDLSSGAASNILVCNHLCMFDIVAIFSQFRRCTTFVSTKYMGNPLLRPMIAACGYVPVGAEGAGAGVEPFLRAEEAVKGGRRIVIFPEATRSRNGELGALKNGAFQLAAATGEPITPVFFTIDRPFLNKGRKYTFTLKCIQLHAYIMPPIAVDLERTGRQRASALREEFLRRHDAFTSSPLVLDFNRARPRPPALGQEAL